MNTGSAAVVILTLVVSGYEDEPAVPSGGGAGDAIASASGPNPRRSLPKR
jgi:hypothetical protein